MGSLLEIDLFDRAQCLTDFVFDFFDGVNCLIKEKLLGKLLVKHQMLN